MKTKISLLLLFVYFILDGQESDFSANICQHIQVLASDDFEGRKPGTPGEEKTLLYIKEQFEEIGLQPAAEDGSFFQKVELATFSTLAPNKIELKTPGGTLNWRHKKDFILASHLTKEKHQIPVTEIVFAGFGIHAPEIGWDDYKELDVDGKIVLVLSGTPDEFMAEESDWKGDPAANLYSKGFYKRNEAAARGAKGVLFIYKQPSHSYWTWESLGGSFGQDDTKIKKDSSDEQLEFYGVIRPEAARLLFQYSGLQDFNASQVALAPDFRGIPLNAFAEFSFSNVWADLNTHNVVGLLPGTNRADEVILYTAHWDHVGIGPAIKGDSIRNGAVDNASGTAGIIEIARAFKKQPNKNRRSILFIATGAEEMGLLGAVWYAKHPLFPLGKTVASLNLDSHFPYGKTTHITGVVYGRSDLDDFLKDAAEQQGRIIVPNTEQNIAQDIFFRSDHFPLAEAGIPSEFAVGAGSAMGHDSVVWEQKMRNYMPKYHQPTDEYEDDFDCGGIWQDAELIYLTGKYLDQSGVFPNWKADQPFQRWREKSRFESQWYRDVSATHLPLMSLQGRSMDAKSADLDGDGDLDIVVANEHAFNIILINDGSGKFTDESQKRLPLRRGDSEDIAIADFDGDGDLDIIFVAEDDQLNEYLENDGKGYFRDISYRLPVKGTSNAVITADINNDGYPDLLIGNAPSRQGQGGQNFCLINDSKGNWLDESSQRLPTDTKATQDLELGDIDGDGDLDLIVANEDDNQLLLNNGSGVFVDETESRLSYPKGKWETREADFGDFDGDGDLDLFFANVNFRQIKDHQNRLFINDGNGHFTDVTAELLPQEKMHTVDGDFLDVDQDGDLDILTGNGFGHSYMAYMNEQNKGFQKGEAQIYPPSVKGDGIDLESADFNGDGIKDLYLCNFQGHDFLLLGKPAK